MAEFAADMCACGHEHTAGRVGSCSKFICPCNRWRPPEEEGDRDVSPRPESAQPEGVVEGVATGSPSSSCGTGSTPQSHLERELAELRKLYGKKFNAIVESLGCIGEAKRLLEEGEDDERAFDLIERAERVLADA